MCSMENDSGARRGQRIGLAEVRRDRKTQLDRLIHQRPQQGRVIFV